MADIYTGYGVICPLCGTKTKTIDSRMSPIYPEARLRRRICPNCGIRFSTIEVSIEHYAELLRLSKTKSRFLTGKKGPKKRGGKRNVRKRDA